MAAIGVEYMGSDIAPVAEPAWIHQEVDELLDGHTPLDAINIVLQGPNEASSLSSFFMATLQTDPVTQ